MTTHRAGAMHCCHSAHDLLFHPHGIDMLGCHVHKDMSKINGIHFRVGIQREHSQAADVTPGHTHLCRAP